MASFFPPSFPLPLLFFFPSSSLSFLPLFFKRYSSVFSLSLLFPFLSVFTFYPLLLHFLFPHAFPSPPFLSVQIPRKILSHPRVFGYHALSFPDCRTTLLPPPHRGEQQGRESQGERPQLHHTVLHILELSSPSAS